MAEKKPNAPDDKKTTPANDTQNNEKTAPGNEPENTAAKQAEKAAQDKLLSDEEKRKIEEALSGDDKKDVDDKKKAAPEKVVRFTTDKKAVGKSGPVKEDKKSGPGLSPADEKKKQEQEALLKTLDEKAALNEKKKAAPKKKQEGRPPTGPKEQAPPPEPEKQPEPREAPRPEEKEEVVYIKLSDIYPFKDHPFQVREDEEMAAMVDSVLDKGITQPATVRPREGGGYEMVSGHRRQKASELAGFTDMPCIIKNLDDEQAIAQMVEDNTTQRDKILPSEKAKALKMQLDAIKRQGARDGGDNNGERSNAIVAKRNNMSVKNVQRYIKLNELDPSLMKYVDHKIDKISIGFTTAVELAFISKKNQQYIAVAIEGNQASPSPQQAQRMRKLDKDKLLKEDTIDGILMEQKKEVDKVILSTQELSQYFGKDKSPQDMKDTIIKLLDEYKAKNPELTAPDKKKNEQDL